jgi:hypothetical protein
MARVLQVEDFIGSSRAPRNRPIARQRPVGGQMRCRTWERRKEDEGRRWAACHDVVWLKKEQARKKERSFG